MKKVGQYLKTISQKLYPAYDYFVKYPTLNRIIGYIENNQVHSLNDNLCEIESTEKDLQQDILISTKGAGLLYVKENKCYRLFPYDIFYGVTKHNGYWFAFHQVNFTGRIIRFRFHGTNIVDLSVIVWGLSRGIHQIDFIKNKLVVTDTYHNRIIEYKNPCKINNEYFKKSAIFHYPNGTLQNNRNSINYNHFNSVYCYNDEIYIIAHNETYKTQKYSEIYILDLSFTLKRIVPAEGSNCHNYYKDKGNEIVCRSLEGEVALNDQENVINVNMFTRGLSITKNTIIFGGSFVQPDRKIRGYGASKVFICDKKFNIQSELSIKDAQVQEIRVVNEDDYGMSDSSLS